jgi:hypothetical protein
MQCPHCRHEFDTKPHTFALGVDPDGTWQVASTRCPTCDRLIVSLCTDNGCSYPAWPAGSMRPWLSPDIPAQLAAEYHTASQVLHYSPEASAAISRRLLSRFLADYLDAGEGDLAQQIDAAVAMPQIPGYIKEALVALSQVAKLPANETKSLYPQALAGAEPGEAEWLLDILDPLFEFYFVQPAHMQRKVALLEEQIGPLNAISADARLDADDTEEAVAEETAEPADETAGEAQAPEPAAEVDVDPVVAAGPTPLETGPTADDAPPAEQPSTGPAPTENDGDRGGWRRLTGR